MLLKKRIETDELRVLRALSARMELSDKEKYYYLNLERGYGGEMEFDSLADELLDERYIIHDLLLEVNNSHIQLDSLIISQGGIHVLDVKNYAGDYYYEAGKLYSKGSGRELKNPVDQLKRSVTLLRQFLQNNKLNYLVEASVVYINPEFTLYQAPLDQPIILPTQLSRFIRELNSVSSKLNDGHKKLAETLISSHKSVNPFTRLPEFTYDQLQKGIYCGGCKSYLISVRGSDLVCKKCGEAEKIEQAIVRSIAEFKLLFPGVRLTTQGVYDWCQLEVHKRTISRILKKHYKLCGKTSDTFYV